MRPAVSYIRVSKPKQGRSGLGLVPPPGKPDSPADRPAAAVSPIAVAAADDRAGLASPAKPLGFGHQGVAGLDHEKRKGQAFDTPGPDLPPKWAGYFSEVEMLLKLVLSCVPTPCTAVMIAIAMPAAIRPYSMAVAPDSSLKNFEMSDFMAGSTSVWCAQNGGLPQFLCGTYGMEPKVALTEEIILFGILRHETCINLKRTTPPPAVGTGT